MFSNRTKYIDIKTSFINEHIESNEVRLEYISTKEMPADVLTKAVNANLLLTHTPTLGLNNPIIG